MNKIFRFLAICTFSVAFASIVWAQTYMTVDYPGAVGTTLNGGPNPQGTSVGSYSSDSFISTSHGFTLTSKGVFTSFDPPGSLFTTPNSISPQEIIVGSYFDSSFAQHGFVLANGQYTTVDYPSAARTSLNGMNPSGEIVGFYCATAPDCINGITHSFILSKKDQFTSFDPPGAISSSASNVNPSGAIAGA